MSSVVSRNLKEHVFPHDGSSYRTQEVPRSQTRGTLSGVEVDRRSPSFTGQLQALDFPGVAKSSMPSVQVPRHLAKE